MHPFARDNIVFLTQGLDLLDSIDDALFVATVPPVFGSSVGSHIRHILDHFDCLLSGLDNGRVDYDCRGREQRVELDLGYASERVRDILARLATLGAERGDTSLQVKMDGGGDDDANTWSQSSLTRELQFLTSHTIHHYAIVAAMLGQLGHRPPVSFGVSPSTLAYEKSRRAAAG